MVSLTGCCVLNVRERVIITRVYALRISVELLHVWNLSGPKILTDSQAKEKSQQRK